MTRDEAIAYVKLATIETAGTTLKAIKSIVRDSEKLGEIELILDDYVGEAYEIVEKIKAVLKQE